MAAGKAGVDYLALLRGVNVGGNNPVSMADLRDAFEKLGFTEVSTYINSGNVLFRAPRRRRAELAAEVEAALTRRFKVEIKVVIVTEAELRSVVERAPRGFGAKTERCDVLFLRKPLTVRRALGVLEIKEGVDRAWAGKGVVYFSRLAARASSSRISKFASTPEYKDTTIRSWSTTTTLLDLIDARSD